MGSRVDRVAAVALVHFMRAFTRSIALFVLLAASAAAAKPAAAKPVAPSDAAVRDIAYRWMKAVMAKDYAAAKALTAPTILVSGDDVGPRRCKSARDAAAVDDLLGCVYAVGSSFTTEWVDLDKDWSDFPVNRVAGFLPKGDRAGVRTTGFDTSNDCTVRVLIAVAHRAEGDRVVGLDMSGGDSCGE